MLQRHNHRRGRRFSNAKIAVNRVCIEIDGITSFDMVGELPMTNIETSRQQIEKLATGMLMRARHASFLQRQKLREVGIKLSIRHVIPQALKEIRRIVDSGLRKAHALVASMHSK